MKKFYLIFLFLFMVSVVFAENKVVQFLKDSGVFYLATNDGNQPKLRPFGAVEELDGTINLCTGGFKDVYKQIIKNPKVEIVALNKENKWIRITGELVDNTNDKTKNSFFKKSPQLKNIYKDKENEFKVLKFKTYKAVINSMDGKQEVVK